MALTDNLVAHYWLGSDSSDSYGTSDGVTHGGVVFNGDSATFDGIDGYIDSLFTVDTSSSYTFSFWLTRDGVPSEREFIFWDLASNGQDKTSRLLFEIWGDGVIGVSVGDGTSFWRDDTSYNISGFLDNTEHNIVFTIDDYTLKLYIDNSLKHVYTTDVLAGAAGERPYSFGRPGEYDGFYFNGKLANFRYYNDLKDEAFVSDLYSEGSSISFVKDIFLDVSEDMVINWTHFLDTSRDLIPTYQTFSDVSEDAILSTYIFQDISIDHQGYIQIFSDVSANTGGLKWSRFYDISNDEPTIFEDILIKRVNS